MAIALDAHTAGGIVSSIAGSSPQNFFHNCGSGSDRLLVVTVQMRGGSGGVVTGITYNGDAMTAVDTEAISGSAHTVMYYLVNPDSGDNTVSIVHTLTGGTSMVASATSLTGVDQSNPLNASNKAAASSAGPMTTSVTTTVANCWVIDSCAMRTSASDTATMTAVTNRVERTNSLTAANGLRGLSSTIGPAASAGSHTTEWTKSLNHDWAIMAAAFAPAASGDISGTSSLTFATIAGISANGALSGSLGLTFAAAGTLVAPGAITGSTSLALGTSGLLTATGALSGSSALALAPAGTLTANAALAGSSALGFALAGTLTAPGGLSGTATLSFSLVAALTAQGFSRDQLIRNRRRRRKVIDYGMPIMRNVKGE